MSAKRPGVNFTEARQPLYIAPRADEFAPATQAGNGMQRYRRNAPTWQARHQRLWLTRSPPSDEIASRSDRERRSSGPALHVIAGRSRFARPRI